MATAKSKIITHEGRQFVVIKGGLVPYTPAPQSSVQSTPQTSRDSTFIKGVFVGILLCVLAQIVGGYFAQLDPAIVKQQVSNLGK